MSTALRTFVYRAVNFIRQFRITSPSYFFYRSFIGHVYGGYGSGPIGNIVLPPTPVLNPQFHSFWIGHTTESTATITARILDAGAVGTRYILSFSVLDNFISDNSSFSGLVDEFGIVKFEINNLTPGTRYYIRILNSSRNIIGGNFINRGSFKTASGNNFKFAFGSCSMTCPPSCDTLTFNTASNAYLYDNIVQRTLFTNEIDFFVHLGDMHYRDISINNEIYFHEAFNSVFSSQRQNTLWKNIPMYYMWDDHDYGPNDTDKNNPARNAAIAAYRRRVPSPVLARNGSTDAVYYSFIRGRARFIVTDLRSEREPKGLYPSTDSQQQIFSSTQKTWFFNEMLAAKATGQFIIWVNTYPWVSSIQNGKDDWGGYHYARMEIVNFINENSLASRILIISGDMHALAFDDGTSVNNYGALKVCHAAPLDENYSVKGGPYTEGPLGYSAVNPLLGLAGLGPGRKTQYGIIEVTDSGLSTVFVRFKGICVDVNDTDQLNAIDRVFSLSTAI